MKTKTGLEPRFLTLYLDWNMSHVTCAQRDSDPEEYPTALLNPSVCARELLHHIYALIVRTPTLTSTDRKLRDSEIFRRYQMGDSTATLADAFGFSVKHIRHIVRVAKLQEANHD